MYEKLKKLSENRAKHLCENSDPSGWFKWSDTYFDEMEWEIAEARVENRWDNSVYLEDELWDVFWNCLMIANTLKQEWKIDSVDAILKRAYNKFSERLWTDGKQDLWTQWEWNRIKRGQKVKRQKEHDEKYSK